MLASDILEVIGRRHARFQEKRTPASAANLSEADLVNLRINEEYDSLIAEIEGLRRAATHAHAPFAEIQDDPDDRSEEWILGDQGQPGG
jgi:hypothetical protein